MTLAQTLKKEKKNPLFSNAQSNLQSTEQQKNKTSDFGIEREAGRQCP